MRRRAAVVLAALVAVAALAALPASPLPGQENAAAIAQESEPAAGAPGMAGSAAATAQEPEHGAAQEEHAAEEHDGEHAGPSWLEYTFKWINFVLLAVVLWWLLVVPPPFVIENFDFPGLKVVLGARSREIVESRDLAREQVATAEATVAASEARLQRVEEEAAALVAEAEEDAARERERLIASAEQEAGRIRDHASRDMTAEVTRARRELKRHVADLSVGMAADMVKNDLSPEDQERLVREYLDRLGQTVA